MALNSEPIVLISVLSSELLAFVETGIKALSSSLGEFDCFRPYRTPFLTRNRFLGSSAGSFILSLSFIN